MTHALSSWCTGVDIMTCEARQYSDEMICCKCALTWDVKDPQPPKCIKSEKLEQNDITPAQKILVELFS